MQVLLDSGVTCILQVSFTICYIICYNVNEPLHRIVKVKVNVRVEVMKPVLSKNNVEARKLVNNRKAPCEIVSSVWNCVLDVDHWRKRVFSLIWRVWTDKPLLRSNHGVFMSVVYEWLTKLWDVYFFGYAWICLQWSCLKAVSVSTFVLRGLRGFTATSALVDVSVFMRRQSRKDEEESSAKTFHHNPRRNHPSSWSQTVQTTRLGWQTCQKFTHHLQPGPMAMISTTLQHSPIEQKREVRIFPGNLSRSRAL